MTKKEKINFLIKQKKKQELKRENLKVANNFVEKNCKNNDIIKNSKSSQNIYVQIKK